MAARRRRFHNLSGQRFIDEVPIREQILGTLREFFPTINILPPKMIYSDREFLKFCPKCGSSIIGRMSDPRPGADIGLNVLFSPSKSRNHQTNTLRSECSNPSMNISKQTSTTILLSTSPMSNRFTRHRLSPHIQMPKPSPQIRRSIMATVIVVLLLTP